MRCKLAWHPTRWSWCRRSWHSAGLWCRTVPILCRQLYVLDTYCDAHNRAVNHGLAALLLAISLVFVGTALTLTSRAATVLAQTLAWLAGFGHLVALVSSHVLLQLVCLSGCLHNGIRFDHGRRSRGRQLSWECRHKQRL